MHHTSGLRNYDDLFDLEGIPEANLTTDRDAMELIVRHRGVNFKLGEEFLFSDANFFLMEQIVKRLTGQTLRQFAQDPKLGCGTVGYLVSVRTDNAQAQLHLSAVASA